MNRIDAAIQEATDAVDRAMEQKPGERCRYCDLIILPDDEHGRDVCCDPQMQRAIEQREVDYSQGG